MVESLRRNMHEVIARHGNGKVEGPIEVGDDDLPYHMGRETTYQFVIGAVKINRAYYWRKGEKGSFPLDAELNLPYRRYSYLLDKWVQSSDDRSLPFSVSLPILMR